MKRILNAASLLALVAGLAIVGAANGPARGTGRVPGMAAQRAWLDPATGALRAPTEEELAAQGRLQAAQSVVLPQAAPTEGFQLPDGTVGVRLPRRYEEQVVLCRQPDGHFGQKCPATGSVP